jgi:hypothetical protein
MGDMPHIPTINYPPNHDSAGLPRPKAAWRRPRHQFQYRAKLPDTLPVPWINGPRVRESGDWHGFRKDATRAHHERLCIVCGEKLHERILIGSVSGQRETAGPGGHPRCILLAVNRCPHIAERDSTEIVAFEYIGPGVGYIVASDQLETGWGAGEDIVPEARPLTRPQVARIAQADPWGESTAVIEVGTADVPSP